MTLLMQTKKIIEISITNYYSDEVIFGAISNSSIVCYLYSYTNSNPQFNMTLGGGNTVVYLCENIGTSY